jgi:ankyrin repeat protein
MKNKLSEIIFILTLAICSNTYITTPCRATMLLPIQDKVPPRLNKSIKLFSAVRETDPEATALAIRSGADVDMPDIGGSQALHIAAQYEDAEILKILLSANPNRAKKDCCSNTALLYAIEKNRRRNFKNFT